MAQVNRLHFVIPNTELNSNLTHIVHESNKQTVTGVSDSTWDFVKNTSTGEVKIYGITNATTTGHHSFTVPQEFHIADYPYLAGYLTGATNAWVSVTGKTCTSYAQYTKDNRIVCYQEAGSVCRIYLSYFTAV